jgi:hypothetical protein
MLAGKAVVFDSLVFLSGTGRVKRYGICSEESYITISIVETYILWKFKLA